KTYPSFSVYPRLESQILKKLRNRRRYSFMMDFFLRLSLTSKGVNNCRYHRMTYAATKKGQSIAKDRAMTTTRRFPFKDAMLASQYTGRLQRVKSNEKGKRKTRAVCFFQPFGGSSSIRRPSVVGTHTRRSLRSNQSSFFKVILCSSFRSMPRVIRNHVCTCLVSDINPWEGPPCRRVPAVSPFRGVIRFGKRGKLHPLFTGPFEVLERVGDVAYRLALTLELSSVHNVFHVSMLRKYVCDPDHVITHTDIQIHLDLSYEERPVAVLDRQVRRLRKHDVPLVRIQWDRHGATWEQEADIRSRFPDFHGLGSAQMSRTGSQRRRCRSVAPAQCQSHSVSTRVHVLTSKYLPQCTSALGDVQRRLVPTHIASGSAEIHSSASSRPCCGRDCTQSRQQPCHSRSKVVDRVSRRPIGHCRPA
ncbi:Unknown protein, partial [Striga hermonthica]